MLKEFFSQVFQKKGGEQNSKPSQESLRHLTENPEQWQKVLDRTMMRRDEYRTLLETVLKMGDVSAMDVAAEQACKFDQQVMRAVPGLEKKAGHPLTFSEAFELLVQQGGLQPPSREKIASEELLRSEMLHIARDLHAGREHWTSAVDLALKIKKNSSQSESASFTEQIHGAVAHELEALARAGNIKDALYLVYIARDLGAALEKDPNGFVASVVEQMMKNSETARLISENLYVELRKENNPLLPRFFSLIEYLSNLSLIQPAEFLQSDTLKEHLKAKLLSVLGRGSSNSLGEYRQWKDACIAKGMLTSEEAAALPEAKNVLLARALQEFNSGSESQIKDFVAWRTLAVGTGIIAEAEINASDGIRTQARARALQEFSAGSAEQIKSFQKWRTFAVGSHVIGEEEINELPQIQNQIRTRALVEFSAGSESQIKSFVAWRKCAVDAGVASDQAITQLDGIRAQARVRAIQELGAGSAEQIKSFQKWRTFAVGSHVIGEEEINELPQIQNQIRTRALSEFSAGSESQIKSFVAWRKCAVDTGLVAEADINSLAGIIEQARTRAGTEFTERASAAMAKTFGRWHDDIITAGVLHREELHSLVSENARKALEWRIQYSYEDFVDMRTEIIRIGIFTLDEINAFDAVRAYRARSFQ